MWPGSLKCLMVFLCGTDKFTCPCFLQAVSLPRDTFILLDPVARTSSLVRGVAESILVYHGQTQFVRATVRPCHQLTLRQYPEQTHFFGGTDKFTCPWYRQLYPSRSRTNKFVRATSFKNERHMRLPMPTMPTIRNAHWSPRACPTNPMVRGPVISPSSL